MFSPPEMMTSFLRSTTWRLPLAALVVEQPELDAEPRHAGAGAPRPVVRGGLVVGVVHGEQRRRLGEPVDLDELEAELALEALDERGGRGRAGDREARPRGEPVLRAVRVVEDRG